MLYYTVLRSTYSLTGEPSVQSVVLLHCYKKRNGKKRNGKERKEKGRKDNEIEYRLVKRRRSRLIVADLVNQVD
jgi:hypothetical protein